MRIIYLIFFLCFCYCGKTQQKMEVYPEDKCAEHVSYGAFLPANINKNQDDQTKKNLEKYQLEFKVDKETYAANETVRVVLSNKGEKPLDLNIQTINGSRKKDCESKNKEYFVWIGEQAEISLIRLVFCGEKKTIAPGQNIEFNIHLSQPGKYKLGLLADNTEAFGDNSLIVTPAFEITAQ